MDPRRLIALVLLLPCLTWPAAYDPVVTFRNAANAGNDQFVGNAPKSEPGIWIYDFSTSPKIQFYTIGSGLVVSSGALTASPVAADWSTLTGKPSTFPPSAHTHPASEISDSTTVGRAVMTAVDAAAARTAIGAGTGSGTVTSVAAGTGLSGGTITTTGTISMPNTGTAGAYSGVTTDAQGRVTAGTNRSFAYSTRALNTCFQISSTRDAFATYAVDILTSSTLLSGQVGTVYLRIYTNSACTTGTQEISRFVNGNTQTLGLSVTMQQNVTGTLTGIIPGASWVQLVTENTTGTPSFTARPGQEVLQ